MEQQSSDMAGPSTRKDVPILKSFQPNKKRKTKDGSLCIICGCGEQTEKFVSSKQGIDKLVSCVKLWAELQDPHYISVVRSLDEVYESSDCLHVGE